MSVGNGILCSMAREVPYALRYLASSQFGVVSRPQALRAGLTVGTIRYRVNSGRWRQVYPGVYTTFTGDPSHGARLWAAVLSVGSGADSVHRVTGATGAQAGIVARAEVTGIPRRLPTGTEVVLLRVCQEALANVRQHAAAHQVRVRLCYGGGSVRLTVTDDGKGFDPAGQDGGYGLTGMADRVGLVGGTVEVTSAPGAGTEVRAEVPG
jgi:histidine kinase/DNA gyrase B/HSP90-like ATPase/putative AbiEi antitoxin of type IV toxin-antitoxin system